MTKKWGSRMERRRAESILTGAPDPSEPLGFLVARAAAEGTSEELAGESEAVAHFRLSAESIRSASSVPIAGRRRLTSKIVASVAVGAGTAVTGVAVAAATGGLPARLQQPAHDIFNAPAPSSRPATPAPTPGDRSRSATHSPGTGGGTESATSSAGSGSATASNGGPSRSTSSSPSTTPSRSTTTSPPSPSSPTSTTPVPTSSVSTGVSSKPGNPVHPSHATGKPTATKSAKPTKTKAAKSVAAKA